MWLSTVHSGSVLTDLQITIPAMRPWKVFQAISGEIWEGNAQRAVPQSEQVHMAVWQNLNSWTNKHPLCDLHVPWSSDSIHFVISMSHGLVTLEAQQRTVLTCTKLAIMLLHGEVEVLQKPRSWKFCQRQHWMLQATRVCISCLLHSAGFSHALFFRWCRRLPLLLLV